jgi:hypothetical protein
MDLAGDVCGAMTHGRRMNGGKMVPTRGRTTSTTTTSSTDMSIESIAIIVADLCDKLTIK